MDGQTTGRRDFLRALALGVPLGVALASPLGRALASPDGAADGAAPRAAKRVPGIQLYTVRAQMQQDVEGTLGAIAKMGYKEVEFAGYFNRDPKALRTTLDGLGLAAPSAHVPLEALRGSLGQVLDAANTLGHQYVVCPFVMPADRTDDSFKRIADDLPRIGAETKARGVQLAYHNHDFEFKPMADGRLPYDLLLATDPSLVKMEVDLYWITYAGKDPLTYFNRYPGRFPLCHVKDMRRANGERAMADVGQGSIDFRAIFARAKEAGFQHYFVERDDAKDPLASARTSEQALRRLLA